MAIAINQNLLLWAVGTIQPANSDEVAGFISHVTQDSIPEDIPFFFRDQLRRLAIEGLVVQVSQREGLFSLTERGNDRLSSELRRLRDRIRLFLLKKAKNVRKAPLGDRQQMGGASPSGSEKILLKEVARPIRTTALPHGRTNWPRIGKQFLHRNVERSPSIPPTPTFPANRVRFYCTDGPFDGTTSEVNWLALAIGISPRLITSFIHKSEKHYRHFPIAKKNGGVRNIDAPRVFLKTVQHWILDYILVDLNSHAKCFSYRRGFSIEDNAAIHSQQGFVYNIDIENFFGSISTSAVNQTLTKQGIPPKLAKLLSYLCTFKGSLPQGAPTSPVISNSYLYDFDVFIDRICYQLGCNYSRYADDITISGNEFSKVGECIAAAEQQLRLFRLKINTAKRRVQSKNTRQLVTGLVVNTDPKPPRTYRRQIRAFFHQIKNVPNVDPKGQLCKMYGYYSYLSSFKALSENKELIGYRRQILEFKSIHFPIMHMHSKDMEELDLFTQPATITETDSFFELPAEPAPN
ncbi:MAG: RNA-directed DNA polymerase [Geobacter sp.]|nr:MAG: RNA-directed DNA polymerase [Geobacter sp.]